MGGDKWEGAAAQPRGPHRPDTGVAAQRAGAPRTQSPPRVRVYLRKPTITSSWTHSEHWRLSKPRRWTNPCKARRAGNSRSRAKSLFSAVSATHWAACVAGCTYVSWYFVQ